MTSPTIAIIILAAGESTRMGLPKQLLPMRGKNLLRHTIDQATRSKAQDVYVVLGSRSERIQKKLGQGSFQIVMNPEWSIGMSSSIRAGISALKNAVDGAIISLSDQPFVSSQVFDSLIDTFASSEKSIVACDFGGSFGPPVLFSSKHFARLSALKGDAGAKSLVTENREEVEHISFSSGSVDLDTPEDYKQFLQNDLGM